MIVALGVLAYGGLGLAVAIAIGKTISQADARELPPCCPHPEAEAPETVRGQFRAVVIR